MGLARGEMEKTAKAGGGHFASLSNAAGKASLAIAGGAVAVGVASAKMAGDFQQNMSKLVTSGGELQKNLGADMKGVLKLMGDTGTSSQQLSAGLYVINSAGYHGAAGLTVLKAAAEGAKTENADLGDVTNGLTTLLNDYRLKASDAALVTSRMVEATSLGKTTFQELAGSLHTVSPIAHAAGLSMNEVLGAMATMTSEGTPAADAATYLRFAIGNLLNPTAKAKTEMQALGISQIDLSKNLGQRGLTGTFQILTDAIQNHMGPAGTVLIEQLKKAAGNTSAFQKILADLPPVQQTYVGALANMVGGTKGMQAALELTGGSAAVFAGNVKKVGGAATEAGGHVAGWSIVQQNFNQKLAEAKARTEVLGIELGQKLIPIFTRVVNAVMGVVNWFAKHKKAAEVLAVTITAVLGAAMVAFTVNKIAQFVGGISRAIGSLGSLAGRSRTTATAVEADDAAMGAAGAGFGAKLSSGLAVATAGVIAFQGTTALLKSNFLGIGDAVKSAAGAIGSFLGIAQVAPQYSAANSTIMWMEQIASGQLHSADYTAAQARADLHKAHIPGYALGTMFVPQTGLAMLHQGEAVIPASVNAGGGAGTTINVYVSGQVVTPDGLAVSLLEPLRRAAARGPHRNSVKTFLS